MAKANYSNSAMWCEKCGGIVIGAAYPICSICNSRMNLANKPGSIKILTDHANLIERLHRFEEWCEDDVQAEYDYQSYGYYQRVQAYRDVASTLRGLLAEVEIDSDTQ